MKTNNEQYRIFNKNLLVYMAGGADMPKVEYEEMEGVKNEALKSKLPEGQKPKNGEEFTRDIDDLLDKVHLDARLDEKNPEETKLKEQIKNHVTDEFKLLEHNYQEQLKIIGRGNEAAKKVWEAFNRAAETFMYQMEMYVLKQSLESKDKEGARQAKIRLLDEFTMEGFGRHLLDAHPDLLNSLLDNIPSTKEEFEKRLTKILDNEELLESAVSVMFNRVPRFDSLDRGSQDAMVKENREKFEFEKLVDDSVKKADAEGNLDLSLTANLGIKNKEMLVNVLTRRFDVKFDKAGKVLHYVDLMEGNTVYFPGKEFDEHLMDICQTELGNPEKIAKYNKQIDEKQDEFWKLNYELKKGFAWKGDNELTGLDSVKNNPTLRKVVGMIEGYEEAVSAPERETQSKLAVLKDIKDNTERGKFEKQITSDKFRSNDWMGAAGALAALVALINELAGKKDKNKEKSTQELAEVTAGINHKENPVEKRKEAKDLYLAFLKDKKPEIADIINLAANENLAGYFTYTGDKSEEKNATMKNYKSQKNEAIKEYMSDKTKLKVTEIDKDGKVTTDKFAFKLSNGGNTVEIFITGQEKPITYSKFDDFKPTLATLGDAISQIKDVAEKKGETEKKVKQYEDALKTLVATKSVKGLSKLGNLVEKVRSLKDKYPTAIEARKALTGENKAVDKNNLQEKLDQMRATFIAQNFEDYKVFLKNDEEIGEKIKIAEKAATTAIAQSTEKPKIDLSAISYS
jgi:hypothetical protein